MSEPYFLSEWFFISPFQGVWWEEGMRCCSRGDITSGTKSDLKSVLITIMKRNNDNSNNNNRNEDNSFKVVCQQILVYEKQQTFRILIKEKRNSQATKTNK